MIFWADANVTLLEVNYKSARQTRCCIAVACDEQCENTHTCTQLIEERYAGCLNTGRSFYCYIIYYDMTLLITARVIVSILRMQKCIYNIYCVALLSSRMMGTRPQVNGSYFHSLGVYILTRIVMLYTDIIK
jgi:hypothetical protein